jgi:predicted TIM-barrel fold metal-dependent hydrolase
MRAAAVTIAAGNFAGRSRIEPPARGTATRDDDVRPVFEELFDRHGLPAAIQTDNVSRFASTRELGGLTPLSARHDAIRALIRGPFKQTRNLPLVWLSGPHPFSSKKRIAR